ncbi:hypothetical protein LEP1GSC186_4457 [Leptospira noguchii serovar Autumnalis str. ZUN142]|uniref:Uncharacterized protein n=1 Tax=Leptospira noguchii serovar Autumnalis str. ZUN142 TaxID=1085540 RepID=M6U6G7_9LEPT|nr:hypothetical protein LEP1GSC186_4457 [Leptospira noguchii serovar Autumnalis str. ZUN142]
MFSLILFLFQFVILGIYLHQLYLKFLSFCPFKIFLIRFLYFRNL